MVSCLVFKVVLGDILPFQCPYKIPKESPKPSVTGIGGGIRVFNGSNPELLNVSIQNNTASLNGGGISYEGLPGNSTIQTMNRGTISGNSSSEGVGGGAYLYSSTVHASRAYIQNNAALSKGGGISIEWASELTEPAAVVLSRLQNSTPFVLSSSLAAFFLCCIASLGAFFLLLP